MKSFSNKTIVAIATPLGVGGVGIVRISGEQSLDIAKQMFIPIPKNIEPNKMYLGKIDVVEFKDKGFFVYFKAPNSYTGEDVVEFQIHGSPIVLNSVVNRVIELGGELANKGEFSQRAFLNGKMSLDEAESLIGLINSTSVAEVKATEMLLSGNLKTEIENLQNDLTDMLAQIDVSFDYPEHDDETQIGVDVKARIASVLQKMEVLLSTYKHGQALTNGVNVCIVGKPNVGKSSLLNAMLGSDSAIVTNIAGTTTDVIKDTYNYNGIRFNIIDTAGIHQGENTIEKIGIEKSKKQIELADLVLFMADNSQAIDENDTSIYDLIKNKKHIVLLNKSDVNSINNTIFTDAMVFTTTSLVDIEKLKKCIYDYTIDNNIAENDIILVNSRHYNAIFDAKTTLNAILQDMDKLTLDCVAVEINYAWQKLGEIVGNTDIEGIIDKIFSKFCLGK